jgi:hypothetical protein
MSARPIALIAAAAMVGGFFLPWMSTPAGASLVPWDTVKGLDAAQIQDMLTSLPPEGMAFFASFALAGLLVLLGLMGAAPRLIVLVTGAIPVGFVAWGLYTAMNQGNAMGIPVSGSDPTQIAEEVARMFGPGAWAWVGGGTLLFLMGLFGIGGRR